MSCTSQNHVIWKDAEQNYIFQTSQLVTSCSDKYVTDARPLSASLLNKIIPNVQLLFFWFDISYCILMEQFRLEGTAEGYLIHLPAQSRLRYEIRLLGALSILKNLQRFWHNCITSLGNRFQHLTILTVKRFFLISCWNLSFLHLCSLSLLLSAGLGLVLLRAVTNKPIYFLSVFLHALGRTITISFRL